VLTPYADAWETGLQLVFFVEPDNSATGKPESLLTPTYSSSLVCRRYTVLMEVKMLGFKNTVLRLRVPLQIYYGEPTQEAEAEAEIVVVPTSTKILHPRDFSSVRGGAERSVVRPVSNLTEFVIEIDD
jgi:hypothetical protein